MPGVTVELSDDEYGQLQQSAAGRGMTPDGLVQRWVRERLVHERERAAGAGKALSPRARRGRDRGE